MIGAGVFTVPAAAAAAAGPGLLLGLGVAGVVAWANAVSSARLAAVLPHAGGTYVYGRARLGRLWGCLAGWGFVVGKVASAAAAALVVGRHVAPDQARLVAVVAVLGVTAVNLRGVTRTATAARLLVVAVLVVLGAVVVAALLGGSADAGRLRPLWPGAGSVLESAGLLFFAFTGYARIATLGEEVRDPATTIRRAVRIALGVALVVYAAVIAAALAAVGADAVARTDAPLVVAVEAGDLDGLAPLVRAGAAVAALGVLLSLVAGIGRTVFAMAADGELPAPLAVVHPVHRVPHRAEMLVAAAVAAVAVSTGIRTAVAFSAFTVLAYYAVTNAAALTLGGRPRDRAVAAFGLTGCAALALSLPGRTVASGVAVLALAALVTRLHPVRDAPPAGSV